MSDIFVGNDSLNQSLGRAGEELVLEYEQKRLWAAGRRDLANRVQHVSATEGDHLGFDVLSFEADGRDRLIEVKTTQFGALTPFFASKNEVSISEARHSEYQLTASSPSKKNRSSTSSPAHCRPPASSTQQFFRRRLDDQPSLI